VLLYASTVKDGADTTVGPRGVPFRRWAIRWDVKPSTSHAPFEKLAGFKLAFKRRCKLSLHGLVHVYGGAVQVRRARRGVGRAVLRSCISDAGCLLQCEAAYHGEQFRARPATGRW
jgi:hypothetical protein